MFAASKTDSVSSAASTDPHFNRVTMLLHGDGTNGARNNTFIDSSSTGATVTRTGNTTQGSFSPYGSNWGNYFDGSSSFSLSNNAALDMGTGDFTLEFWVFSTDASIDSQYRRFFATGTNSTSSIQVGHIAATSGIVAYTADDSTLIITGTTNVLNTWAHIAVVRQSGTVKLYVNGTSEGTPITDSNSKTTSNFTVGRYPGASGYLKGNLSNLRLVKGTAVYTSNFTPSTTPLTAITNTSLLTCQSNRFIDNSTNNFTLTLNSTPSVERFNPFGASTAYSTAVIGGSAYFDGSSQLSFSTNAGYAFGTGDFTVECFYYATSNPGYRSLIETRASNGTSTGWALAADSGGAMYVYSAGFILTGISVVLNTWNHVAFTRSGSTQYLFLNGALVSSTTTSRTYSDTNLGVGGVAYTTGEYWTGQISNVRFIKGTCLYTTTFTPPTAPLTAVSGTSLLLNFTNGAIFDNAMMNNLETKGNSQISTSVAKFGTGSISGFSAGNNYQAVSNAGAIVGNFGSGDFTVELWLNTNIADGAGILTQATGGGAASTSWGFFVGYTSSTSIDFYLSNVTTYFANTGGGVINDNTWHHVAFSRSGSSGKLFVDGTQVGSTLSLGTTALGNGTLPINIGGQGNSTHMSQGYIDDVRITKGYARYTANFTPPTAAFLNTGPY
jgi:hypothetical protein